MDLRGKVIYLIGGKFSHLFIKFGIYNRSDVREQFLM